MTQISGIFPARGKNAKEKTQFPQLSPALPRGRGWGMVTNDLCITFFTPGHPNVH